jgi:hypothetical protein
MAVFLLDALSDLPTVASSERELLGERKHRLVPKQLAWLRKMSASSARPSAAVPTDCTVLALSQSNMSLDGPLTALVT